MAGCKIVILFSQSYRRKDKEKALSAGVRRDTRKIRYLFNVSFPLKP